METGRTKSRSYSKSCLFTVGCTFVLTTPFLLATRCSGLPPPWHMQKLFFFFSKSRWKSGENPTHNDSRWHSVVQNMLLRRGSVGSSYIHFGADLISFRFNPETLLWHHLRWSLNNSILQEEFTSTEQMNANQQEFYFQGQLVLHPTAHQSVILLDDFRRASSHGRSAIWAVPF